MSSYFLLIFYLWRDFGRNDERKRLFDGTLLTLKYFFDILDAEL